MYDIYAPYYLIKMVWKFTKNDFYIINASHLRIIPKT